jgi:phosphocarrier protein FPr
MNLFSNLFSKSYTAVLHITSSNGFHLRPAAVFATTAKTFTSVIEAETRGKSVNAKNLHALLSLNLEQGDHFDLICKGKDAEEALEKLQQTFEALMEDDTPALLHQVETHGYQSAVITAESITPGIAIAPLWHYRETVTNVQEGADFKKAVEQSLSALASLYTSRSKELHAEIYLAQKALLESLAQKSDSLEALETAVTEESNLLKGGKMEAKIVDYQDILSRVKYHMGYRVSIPYPNTPFILVADDLLPSQIETLPKEAAGVILQQSTLTSHSAVLLRASGIPSLILHTSLEAGRDQSILDGHSALLVPHPSRTDIQTAEKRRQQDCEAAAYAQEKRFEKAVTTSGKPMNVLANVTDTASSQKARKEGAEGIGLLRTEFLFTRERPTLETQIEAYRSIFSLFEEITVRTLDVGGDKSLPYIDLPLESNPFLGIRGVRLIRTHPEIIEEQLHAIFKAADGKPVKVMFPMIATVEEFIKAKAFAYDTAQKYSCNIDTIRFGIMVEVPSVLFAMKQFNNVVDFYSIGTNDLAQYLFAIERTHPILSFDPRSDMLFAALEKIVQEADKPISLCGELAGDTEAIPKLIEMGIETLSVSPKRIAPTKETIRHV